MTEQGRMAYAYENRDRYREWCGNVAQGPATPVRRMEFAILSAQTPFESARQAWGDIRGLDGVSALGDAIDGAGVWLTARKALAIETIRNDPYLVLPCWNYRVYRERYKLPGMAWSKLSFAICLIDPLGSNVVCLDTHMVQEYTGKVPDTHWFAGKQRYVELEDVVRWEAMQVGVAPFVYQWAVWDYRRGKSEEHRFLWEEA